jgi:predicted glutamine amidotransferase
MCGICGIRRFGDEPISRPMFEIMLVDNQRRGRDATGVAIQQADGKVSVFKADIPAWNFVGTDAYEEFIEKNLKDDSLTLMGHTRLATKGTPKTLANNHPIWDGTTAVIHNGCLSNDDSLFKSTGLRRVCETDSDIFRAIIAEHGITAKGINELNKIDGSGAIVAMSEEYPGKLLIARSGNPIQIGSTGDFLLWSSEMTSIVRAVRPFQRKFGFYLRQLKVEFASSSMQDNSAYILSPTPLKGTEKGWKGEYILHHQEFKLTNHFTPIKYDSQGRYFGARVKFYGKRPATLAYCMSCNTYSTVPKGKELDIFKMKCGNCNELFRAEPTKS